jgi:hypothetical protein
MTEKLEPIARELVELAPCERLLLVASPAAVIDRRRR